MAPLAGGSGRGGGVGPNVATPPPAHGRADRVTTTYHRNGHGHASTHIAHPMFRDQAAAVQQSARAFAGTTAPHSGRTGETRGLHCAERGRLVAGGWTGISEATHHFHSTCSHSLSPVDSTEIDSRSKRNHVCATRRAPARAVPTSGLATGPAKAVLAAFGCIAAAGGGEGVGQSIRGRRGG